MPQHPPLRPSPPNCCLRKTVVLLLRICTASSLGFNRRTSQHSKTHASSLGGLGTVPHAGSRNPLRGRNHPRFFWSSFANNVNATGYTTTPGTLDFLTPGIVSVHNRTTKHTLHGLLSTIPSPPRTPNCILYIWDSWGQSTSAAGEKTCVSRIGHYFFK